MRHDVTEPLFIDGGPDLQPRLSRLTDSLPVQSGQDRQVERDGRDQHAGAGQAGSRPGSPSVHVRGLRRSHRSSAARDLLGQREPDRTALLLRRGQARRRDADVMDYHREDKVDIRIARIFNTYGPRMAESDGRVVSNFIVQALRGEELTLYGTGEQTRSFCYVDELVDGLMRLMAAEKPARAGQPGQSRRVHHPGAGRRGRSRRSAERSRIKYQPLPAGRPDPAAAGHYPRPRVAGLGAQDPAQRGTRADGRALPPTARAGADPAQSSPWARGTKAGRSRVTRCPAFPYGPRQVSRLAGAA